ncbi:drug resistance transporter, EmrB/QacA subfamily [Amycolatopsis marina]|uniref:Drug resistance transporter, EmrB/QacA subfamily n=1 Tax=Amycolatopsis marina TaxID=490629 RepID=A0A1I0VVV8_9PSEU|nr:MFS transporter [Amycolatopsis marina]SFA80187.1 drug resistance transporter, EmrB/QacA subfamily [Amycolatopsis marina]
MSQVDPPVSVGASPPREQTAQGRPGIAPGVQRTGLVLTFLCVAQFMVFLDVSIVNVALPSIEKGLGIREENLPYVVTLYGTALGGFLLFGSRLADTFGRRLVLRIGLTLFGLASLAGGLAQDQLLLFAARGGQGLGAALIAPAALSIVTTTFVGAAERAKALGIWGALTGIASVAGVILGGVLSDGPGWRWIFFINVPIAVIAVATATRVLPESRGPRRPFDIAGAVLLTAGLLALIYGLDEAISHGWTSALVITSLTGAVLLLGAFAIVERKAEAPLVPFDVFGSRTLRYANIATLFLLGSVVTTFFFASLFLQQVLDYSPMNTGLAYVPLAVVVAVGAGIASNAVAKAPAKAILAFGLVLVGGGLALMARMPSDASYPTQILPVFVMIGLGMGLSFVPLQIAAQADVIEERAGLAAGLINTSQEVGGALGIATAATFAFGQVAQLTAEAGGDPRLIEAARTTVFHDGFAAGAVFAVIALLIAVVLLPRIRKDRPQLAA